jgi:hypothetical protein
MSHPADEPRPRQDLPVVVRHLQDPERDDLSGMLDASQRVALVWELSRRMWELTGRPVPRYDRASMPVRLVRRG